MTEEVKKDVEQIKDGTHIDVVREQYFPVLGRDGIHKVLYHSIVKLILKTFSWSTVWALHGIYIVDIYVEGLKKGEVSYIPFIYAGVAWFNMLLRPQLKKLIAAYSKKIENGK